MIVRMVQSQPITLSFLEDNGVALECQIVVWRWYSGIYFMDLMALVWGSQCPSRGLEMTLVTSSKAGSLHTHHTHGDDINSGNHTDYRE